MKEKIIACLIVLGAMAGTVCPLAGANQNSMVSDQLVAEGKYFYDNGDYAKAIHEFSKALLVEPNNAEAQRYLNELGVNVSVLFSRGSRRYRMAGLAKNIDWYKIQVSKLEQDNIAKERLARALKSEKERLSQTLAGKEEENKILKDKMDEVQQHFRDKADEDRSMIKSLETTLAKQEKDLACLNDEICTLEDTLLTKVTLVEEQKGAIKKLADDVRDIKREAKLRAAQDRALIEGVEKTAQEKTREIAKLNLSLVKMKDNLLASRDVIGEKEEALDQLSLQVSAMEREKNDISHQWRSSKLEYEKTIQDMEEELARHKNKIDKTGEQYSTEMKRLKDQLRDKRAELSAKENRLTATKYKLKVTTRMLESQNRSVIQLREALMSLEQELVKVQAADQNEVMARKKQGGNFTPADTARMDFLKRQNMEMSDLKGKLADARAEIRDIEKGKGTSNIKTLLDLKEQLTVLKLQLGEKEAQPEGRAKGTYDLLQSRLTDAETRLAELVKVTQEKDLHFKEMEKQLTELLTQANY